MIVVADYRGVQVEFTDAGWFNATTVASRFGRRPSDWLKLPETRRYMKALARSIQVGRSAHLALGTEGRFSPFDKKAFVRSHRGGDDGGSTWLHPKLGIRFAQWLDVDFAVWCDEQIDNLLHCRPMASVGLYAQRIAFEARKAGSEQKGKIGSKLMHERRREKPALVTEEQQWRLTMEPGLFAALEKRAA